MESLIMSSSTIVLICLNISVFIMQMAYGPAFTQALLLDSSLVEKGQVWRLLTYAFCHGNMLHLLWNMVFLALCSLHIELVIGKKSLNYLYLGAAIFASITYWVTTLLLTGENTGSCVGASGAVMAIMTVFTILNPKYIVNLFFFPIQMRWLWMLFFVSDFVPVINGSQDGIAHTAHLGGMLFGFIFYKHWEHKYKKPVQGFATAVDNGILDSQELDNILQKIHRNGMTSLTKKEHQQLKATSQKLREYKNS